MSPRRSQATRQPPTKGIVCWTVARRVSHEPIPRPPANQNRPGLVATLVAVGVSRTTPRAVHLKELGTRTLIERHEMSFGRCGRR